MARGRFQYEKDAGEFLFAVSLTCGLTDYFVTIEATEGHATHTRLVQIPWEWEEE